MPNNIGVSREDVEVGGLDLSTVTGVFDFYMNRIIKETKENLESDNSNASSQLTQSIRPEFEVKTTKFGVVYTAKILMEDYYEFVDKGRGPGQAPPIVKIENWIRNKEGFRLRGLEKIGDIREKGINKRKPYTFAEILRSNAIGIANKIGKRGTQGTSFFTKVVNQEFYNNLNRDLSKALKKDVEVTIKNLVDIEGKLATGEKRF